MKKKYIFTIPGSPTRVFKSEAEGRQPIDTYMEHKLRYKITLENQYGEEDIIESPVEAIFKFFLPRTHRYRQTRVSLLKLFEFANYTAQGIIYNKDCLLYNITLLKEYSDNPHTEIIIIPLQCVKGGTNEPKKRKKSKSKKE